MHILRLFFVLLVAMVAARRPDREVSEEESPEKLKDRVGGLVLALDAATTRERLREIALEAALGRQDMVERRLETIQEELEALRRRLVEAIGHTDPIPAVLDVIEDLEIRILGLDVPERISVAELVAEVAGDLAPGSRMVVIGSDLPTVEVPRHLLAVVVRSMLEWGLGISYSPIQVEGVRDSAFAMVRILVDAPVLPLPTRPVLRRAVTELRARLELTPIGLDLTFPATAAVAEIGGVNEGSDTLF